MPRFPKETIISNKYADDKFEYRNVYLTEQLYEKIRPFKKRLLHE